MAVNPQPQFPIPWDITPATCGFIYLVYRTNQPPYDHSDWESPKPQTSTDIHSAHTTLRAANRKARVLFWKILREEGAECASDGDERTDRKGQFVGSAMLGQDDTGDGIESVSVSVGMMELRPSFVPPWSDDEDEEECRWERDMSENEEEWTGDSEGFEVNEEEDRAQEDRVREEMAREEMAREEMAREERAREERAREERAQEERAQEARAQLDLAHAQTRLDATRRVVDAYEPSRKRSRQVY